MAVKLHNSFAIHPGPWLRAEVLAPYRMTVTGAATHLGVTRAALSNVLNGKAALSPEMAIRFEKAFGIAAGAILRMQCNHDLARAKEAAASLEIARIPKAA